MKMHKYLLRVPTWLWAHIQADAKAQGRSFCDVILTTLSTHYKSRA